MKPHDLLHKHAQQHMQQWDINAFKSSHPLLYTAIIAAINEASMPPKPFNP